jgi:hypothetical protein
MAQTPQSEESGGAGETTAPGTGRPQGLFGGSTTILLLIFAVAVFWWNRRRRVEIEERLRAQRREADEAAKRSALDVAHLMRAGSQPAAPASGRSRLTSREQDLQALEIERAEARAAAERAAEEQAERASQDAKTAGESAVRRAFAASAAAAEAEADTADATRAGQLAPVPAGAVLGDGTANCPPDYPFKGNRQSRIYHSPGQVSYPSTVAEFCFASAEAAEGAGFRASRAREQRSQQ